ncbi:MAG: MarR family transcriptional regulator [Herbinix sp.]|jgi:DNA-binding MarR family transcriptional regulator|nr:MarR family transcriptional regulator [Herbinix sp.]
MERNEIQQLIESYMSVGRLIHQHSYDSMETMKLYPGQPKFLVLIKKNEGVTQKELAEMHFVKPATITGMLNKLEANHFVYRIPDETDKRIMRVYLTEEGRNLAEQSEKFMHSLTEILFEGFTEEDRSCFVRLTKKMRDNLLNKDNKPSHDI